MSRFLASMPRSKSFCLALLAAFSLAGTVASARAASTWIGDVTPSWDTSTDCYVGIATAGTLTVDGGTDNYSRNGYIGYGSGSTGLATVNGTDSTWTANGSLNVGYSGDGTLSVTDGGYVSSGASEIGSCTGSTGVVIVAGTGSIWRNSSDLYVGKYGNGTLFVATGGSVSVGPATYVGWDTSSTGLIDFGTGGGTLTTRSLFASPTQLTGTGTINAGGLVSDIDLIFDSSHALMQTILLQQSSGTVTVNLRVSTGRVNENLGAGWKGTGSLTIQDSLKVTSSSGYIGYGSGSTGLATVSGTGSTWRINASLYVGNLGSGTLAITNGGSVSVASRTYVGVNAGSTGLIDFGTNGGTLTTGTLFASPTQLTGTGTINAKGIVSDIDLVFDSTHPLSQTTLLQQASGTVTLNLNMAAPNSFVDLGVGLNGNGSLTIKDGLSVGPCDFGYLGYRNGATGLAIVSGSGSTWSVDRDLYVGNLGSGTLTIADGARVSSCRYGYASHVGYGSGSTGLATVDGTGSTWDCRGSLYVGNLGCGTLSITNGGSVSVAYDTYVGWDAGSTGLIDFGTNGGTLTTNLLCVSPTQLTGTGTINTKGIVSDIDLVFDATQGLMQTLMIGQNVAVNLDASTGYLPDLGAGWKGRGSLTIRDGLTIQSNSGYIGFGSGSNGLAMVNGTGSTWRIYSNFYVGNLGSGTLSISNGGTVTTYNYNSTGIYIGYGVGSTGLATVSGTGSIWGIESDGNFYIGNLGSGTLSVSNGGIVACWGSPGGSYIGYESGSTGLATVSGTGSAWTTGILHVGCFGSGTLSISSGGTVTVNSRLDINSVANCYVGTNFGATGTVKVDGINSRWNISHPYSYVGCLYIGEHGSGTLDITNGGLVDGGRGYIGHYSESSGTVTVSGAGSQWLSGEINVGYSGNGTLNISNGGTATVDSADSGYSFIGRDPGATGTVNVDGAGSTFSTVFALFVGGSGSGVLNILDGGYVENGTYGDIGWQPGSAGTVTVSGTGSKWNCGSEVYIGFDGNGVLNIINGGTVISGTQQTGSRLGLHSGVTGAVTVDGAGSKWDCRSAVYIGDRGSGTVEITNGGQVTSLSGYIGDDPGSSGAVTVDGAGSIWAVSKLSVGVDGTAALAITGRGSVQATSVSVNSTSLLAVDIGRGSLLTVAGGAGTVTNNGIIRLLAGAGVLTDATTYSPIFATTWSGSGGVYQAVGGTWDAVNHQFTVSGVAPSSSGLAVSLDLASAQRALISDDRGGGTYWAVGASFVATSSSTVTFSATAASGTLLDALQVAAGSDQTILSAWTFSTDYGLSSSNPIYFSLKVGANDSSDDFELWGYDGSSWTSYAPTDLTYDGTYASFTATGLSGYAISMVPEPGTLALLAAGLFGLLAYARRKRRQP